MINTNTPICLACIKVGSYILLAILFISCKNNNSNDIADRPINVGSDSVFMWIQESKKTAISLPERAKGLQNAYIQAEHSSNDSLKARYFSELSLAYLKLNDSALFRATNRQAIILAQKIADSVIQADAHWDIASFFRKNTVVDSAYYHFARAQKIYNALNDNFYSARMLYNMALVQADVKDYIGSEITTIKAIELLKPLNKYKHLYSCYNNLGSITIDLEEYDRALIYYNDALEYLEKMDSESILKYNTLNNIGVAYQEQGDYKKAIPYFKQVLENGDILKTHAQLYAKTLNNLALSNLKLKKYTELPEQFNQAIHLQDSINDFVGLSRSHYSLAEYYLNQEDSTKALKQAQNAKLYAEQSSNNERLLETLPLLGRIDPNNSFGYMKRFIALSDSLQKEERKARNKFARIRFETDEFIAENEVLNKQKRIWAAIAFGLLLLASAAYIILNQRAKNQKLLFKQQQQANNEEIFNLMLSQKQKVEEGKQGEQKRISEELHDGVLGKMLGARMILTGLNKKIGDEVISERATAISVLKEVEGEVRSISHELSHAAYQKINNFIGSVQELLKTVSRSSKIDYEFKYTDTLDWDSLNGEIKINLYRLVQESLQNAVKHANCKNILINFEVANDYLTVLIKDDGKGFRAKNSKKGIGMRNIASRIEKLKGSWNIDSKIGAGTSVTYSIPIAYYSVVTQNNKIENQYSKESVI